MKYKLKRGDEVWVKLPTNATIVSVNQRFGYTLHTDKQEGADWNYFSDKDIEVYPRISCNGLIHLPRLSFSSMDNYYIKQRIEVLEVEAEKMNEIGNSFGEMKIRQEIKELQKQLTLTP